MWKGSNMNYYKKDHVLLEETPYYHLYPVVDGLNCSEYGILFLGETKLAVYEKDLPVKTTGGLNFLR